MEIKPCTRKPQIKGIHLGPRLPEVLQYRNADNFWGNWENKNKRKEKSKIPGSLGKDCRTVMKVGNKRN